MNRQVRVYFREFVEGHTVAKRDRLDLPNEPGLRSNRIYNERIRETLDLNTVNGRVFGASDETLDCGSKAELRGLVC